MNIKVTVNFNDIRAIVAAHLTAKLGHAVEPKNIYFTILDHRPQDVNSNSKITDPRIDLVSADLRADYTKEF